MRLRKGQKEAVLQWIAEGLKSDEINERASDFNPPFSVSRRQVTHYRKTRQVDIDKLVKDGEHEALNAGLAKKSERVKKLKQLARLLEKDLFGDCIWLPQVKGVGSGNAAKIVDYEEFNKAEIDAYRGILDDIASEVGHRVKGVDLTSKGEKLESLTNEERVLRMTALLQLAQQRMLEEQANE